MDDATRFNDVVAVDAQFTFQFCKDALRETEPVDSFDADAVGGVYPRR